MSIRRHLSPFVSTALVAAAAACSSSSAVSSGPDSGVDTGLSDVTTVFDVMRVDAGHDAPIWAVDTGVDVTVSDAREASASDAGVDAQGDAVVDAAPADGATDALRDSAEDSTKDAGNDVVVQDAVVQDVVVQDAAKDVLADVAGDATADVVVDATVDAGHDAAEDSGRDAPVDAVVDSPPDASVSPTLLLLAGSATSMLAGQFHSGGSWTTAKLGTGGTPFPPALTTTSDGVGVGAFAANPTTDSGTPFGYMTSTTWTSAGGWTAPVQLISKPLATRAQPFIDATGGTTAHLVYQEPGDYFFQYLAYSAGAWSASPQGVGTSPGNYYGGSPATVAALGSNATIGFIDGIPGADVNFAATADLIGGVWQSRDDISGAAEDWNVEASIIPLSSGPELLIVFVEQTSGQIMFMTRTGTTWSSPTVINTALTATAMALAPLPDGGAILAFHGFSNNYLYWSQYSGGTWSTVQQFQTNAIEINGSPAVTHGISGDVAEMAYVDTTGTAWASSLTGTAWSAPVAVGGSNLVGLAIAATP
jgi:hypothetical protein